MKLTLKLPGNHSHNHHHHPHLNHRHNINDQPIVKAKLPLTILNHPFLSTITSTTTTPSDLTFSLSTNFLSGPSLKLTYCPTTTNPTISPPFSLSLKSGIGLFGSPHNSPLLFSAHFSFFASSTSSPQPIFFLHFKPQFGHFSLSKSTSSNSNPRIGSKFSALSNSDSVLNPRSGSEKGLDVKDGVFVNPSFDQKSGHGLGSNGVVQNRNGEWNSGTKANSGSGSITGSSSWEEVKLLPVGGKEETLGLESNGVHKKLDFPNDRDKYDDRSKSRVYSGVAVRARTVWPITKRLMMNFNWQVNIPYGVGSRMPYLTMNKIAIERAGEGKAVVDRSDGSSSSSRIGDQELLKGMCLWLGRDLELLQKENREMKELLEDMKLGVGVKNGPLDKHSIVQRVPVSPSLGENGGDFEAWRSKRNGKEENGREGSRNDVESQLRKAIKSAST